MEDGQTEDKTEKDGSRRGKQIWGTKEGKEGLKERTKRV